MGKKILKLTRLSSCAGCAAKLPQAALADLMRQVPTPPRDPKLLVGTGTADDAGVYRLRKDLALVQTVDFFTPIVDDAFTYGEIAATNAISDVFAMGGRPLTALNLLGIPAEVVPAAMVAEILRGGLEKATESGCTIVGGHTIRLPEPVYGMAVTGLVSPNRIIANTRARPGDWLVLTKPLGTGIVTTAIKRGLASATVQQRAIRTMTTLNSLGATLAEQGLCRAGTDVTGFGLLGHLANICRGSGVAAEIEPSRVPALSEEVFSLIDRECIPGGSRQNLETATGITDWGKATPEQKYLLTDAQTSGGLLLCIRPRDLDRVLDLMQRSKTPCAAVIGRMVRSDRPEVRMVSGFGAPRFAAAQKKARLKHRRALRRS